MFECKENCGECCGIIPFEKELAKETENLAQVKPTKVIEIEGKIYVITKDMLCVYLNRKTKRCAIYERRPEICRIYGLISKCPCPYFRENGMRRDRLEREIISMKINRTIDRAMEKLGVKIDATTG